MPSQVQCCSVHAADTSAPEVPPRSIFISPTVIGQGTPYSESITSYVTRVAAMNDLTPLQIIHGTNAAPVTKTHPQVKKLQAAAKVSFHRRAASTSEKGAEFIGILASLLDRPELLRLHWSTSFAGHSPARMSRRMDAWCPECLRSDPEPHMRMLWEVPVASCCPIHGCVLQTACHSCGAAVKFAGADLVHCRHCDADRRDGPSMTGANRDQLVTAVEIGRVIALATDPTAGYHVDAATSLAALDAVAESAGRFGFKERAAYLGIDAVSLWNWRRGNCSPALCRLIEVALSKGFSVPEFLEGCVVKADPGRATTALPQWQCVRLTAAQKTHLIQELTRISREFPTWGPVKAAKKLNVEQVTLLNLAPSLYAEMTKRRKVVLARLREARFAWFVGRVDLYVQRMIEEDLRATWTGVSGLFRKRGILKHPRYANYARKALVRADEARAKLRLQRLARKPI